MATPAQVISMDERRKPGPQLDDGFVRVANELEDALLSKIRTFRHSQVVRAVIRKTYGFGKKEDDITISQIAEMTGLHRNHVGAAVKELESMRVLNPVRAGSYGLILGINKHHSQWIVGEKKQRGAATKTVAEATKTVAQNSNQNSCDKQPKQLHDATKTVESSNQNVAHNRQPQKTTPKDNSKRETRKPAAQDLPPAPDWMPEKEWADFVEHRKQIKHPLTALASSRLIEKIGQLKTEGHSPKKLLDAAIRNGWRDVFPKDETRENAVQPAQRPAPPGKRWVAGLLVED